MSEVDARDFALRRNKRGDGFLESEKWGANTAEASKAAAMEGMNEMSKLYKARGEKLYVPEDDS